jgi:hypothetical protein
VTNDVDAIAAALYATTDDMLKEHPDLAPWRPPVGITPHLSDAELVTLDKMQAILGYTSEAKWLRHARAHLRHLFPHLPQQPAYNKRPRKAAGLMLLRERSRRTLIGDKNYFGRGFERELSEHGVQLLRPARKDERERPGAALFKPLRQVIERAHTRRCHNLRHATHPRADRRDLAQRRHRTTVLPSLIA